MSIFWNKSDTYVVLRDIMLKNGKIDDRLYFVAMDSTCDVQDWRSFNVYDDNEKLVMKHNIKDNKKRCYVYSG